MLDKAAILASLAAIHRLNGNPAVPAFSDDDWNKICKVYKYHPAIFGEADIVRVLSMHNSMTIIDDMYRTAEELHILDVGRNEIIEARKTLRAQMAELDKRQEAIDQRTNKIWRGDFAKPSES